jgi:DNA-directed RNA polymerase sigma subunit (sigma70/sigma32)
MSSSKLSDIKAACRDHRPGPAESVMASETRQRLAAALDALSDVQIQVVNMRFGLDGNRPRSITFVAKILRIKPDAARAALETALIAMRADLAESPDD